jgi:hypothetical protein
VVDLKGDKAVADKVLRGVAGFHEFVKARVVAVQFKLVANQKLEVIGTTTFQHPLNPSHADFMAFHVG